MGEVLGGNGQGGLSLIKKKKNKKKRVSLLGPHGSGEAMLTEHGSETPAGVGCGSSELNAPKH